MSVNKVILVGRLGKDPEMKYIDGGTGCCKFSIATDETWKDKNSGEKQQKTEWHNIVVWRKLAEICGQYLKKGSLVYIEGKMQTRSWKKDGAKHHSTEIVADEMRMLGSKPDSQSASAAAGSDTRITDEDIPF